MLNLSTLPDVGLIAAYNSAAFPGEAPASPGYRDRKWFPVPVHAVGDAESAFAKLASRAAKRLGGVPAPVLEWKARGLYLVTREIDTEDGKIERRYKVPCVFAAIAGEAPKIAGWSLAARIQRLATNERITRNVPGVELPQRVRDLGAEICEHCNTARIRNDVFAVRNVETGEFKQVGKTCLRDFLGHDPAALLAAYTAIESLCESGEKMFGGLWTADTFPTLDVLIATAAVIRVDSWVSRKSSDETGRPSTSSTVSKLMHGRGLKAQERAAYAATAADESIAADTLAYVRGLSATAANDYERNLVASLKHESCDARTFGLVASSVAAYLRAMSRAAELNSRKAANAASVHVGAVKERLRGLVVTIEHMQNIESDFGGCTLVKMRDEAGNLFSTFASGSGCSDAKIGARMVLTGTVKKHADYKGVLETQLSRVVLSPFDTVPQKAAA